ncbi:MAG: Mur ligase domain-containing protein [Leptospirales bacterium]
MNSVQDEIEILIKKKKFIHIIGGGGVGMSALGMLVLHMGYNVSASDKNSGPYLEKFAEKGGRVWTGSSPEQIDKNSVIFYSSAIPETDPERVWARENSVKQFSRHSLLGFITRKYYTISVSGTHGKTTTTAWLGYLLEAAGLDPTVLAGGTMKNWNTNLKIGEGKYNKKPLLVIEADESDESFLYIDTDELLITNIELDHVDHYNRDTQLREKFSYAIEGVSRKGGVVIPSLELYEKEKSNFEFSPAAIENIKSMKVNGLENSISMQKHGDADLKNYTVGLPGVHNVWNASAVLCYAKLHNIKDEPVVKTLYDFEGVGRRMDVLFTGKNSSGASVQIIDDYAHHPTEVTAVLKTLSTRSKNIVPIWEPHRISRFLHFEDDFRKSFSEFIDISKMYLLPLFDAGGEFAGGKFTDRMVHFDKWKTECSSFLDENNFTEMFLSALESAVENTVFIFLGAGNSSEYAHLAAKLANRK